jgi:hypothetical protein
LPADGPSPFRVFFDGVFPVHKVTVALKNASGNPVQALDKRRRRGWTEVVIKDRSRPLPSPEGLPTQGGAPSADRIEPTGARLAEESTGKEQPPLENPEGRILSSSESQEETADRVKAVRLPEENLSLDLDQDSSGAEGDVEKGRQDTPPAPPVESDELQEWLGTSSSASLKDHPIEEHAISSDTPWGDDAPEVGPPDTKRVMSVLSEAQELLHGISHPPEEERRVPPWLEDFKYSVENYYQHSRDDFVSWFKACRGENQFENGYGSLGTILAHARFDQLTHSKEALNNTQKVHQLITRQNVSIDEIPSIKGTRFFSGDQWRELFHKAIPRIQQVARDITAKRIWEASELEKLIQIIPHIDAKRSRRAARWVHELLPDAIEIDFSGAAVLVDEKLYRVASRLGVVDPQFDPYHETDSMGYLRIQSFAQTVFPQDPVKIEEPMVQMGSNETEGGTCFPTEPRCEGCLFQSFCPRLLPQIDPSGKWGSGKN